MALGRRTFLKAAAAACAACLAGPQGVGRAARYLALKPGLLGKKLSPFYKPLKDGFIECTLCPHRCRVGPGERGTCGVRQNDKGRYYTLVYGNPCAVHVDPIEKKPLFHVLPGSASFSLATAGCNFHCQFCQNWEISQKSPDETINLPLGPEQVAAEAKAAGALSVASTYVEPTIFMEYMLDIGRAVKKAGILKVMHSNGFMNPEPLGQLVKVLDAACIDLKSSRPEFYQTVCQGGLAPVKETLRRLFAAKVHVEVVHLMIPTLNDRLDETKDLIRFVRDELSPEVPLHLTRFYPQYKLQNLPPTPIGTLTRARQTAMDMGLKYVYLGNVPGNPGENTFCPDCRSLLIERVGYHVRQVNLKKGRCPKCGRAVYGIWETVDARQG